MEDGELPATDVDERVDTSNKFRDQKHNKSGDRKNNRRSNNRDSKKNLTKVIISLDCAFGYLYGPKF